MASSVEVAPPPTEHHPTWGTAGAPPSTPWGSSPSGAEQAKPSPVSFHELMSEDLAKNLEEKENEAYRKSLAPDAVNIDELLSQHNETTDDFALAQMLQYQFDREYDQQLSREEKQYNGNSKVSVSFNKFKLCPDWYGPDSDDELEDIDDENRAIDSFEERKRTDPVIPACGYVKHGTKLVTKHDLKISGRKNAERFMNLPPGINTGDGGGFDMHLSNKVYNKLCRTAMTDIRRKQRVHDKVEKATSEMALDPRTRLLIFKLVNNAILESVNGIISPGKEAVVFHALGGELEDQPLPEDCAVKVFKTTLTDFKTRERYIKDDYRFKDRVSKHNTQKLIQLWAEKEYHNLRRLLRAGIPAPMPILVRKHVLVMSLIGADHQAAPKLKEIRLSLPDLCIAYEQVVEIMTKMFHACHLVHADLSEYNILWYEGQCWIIDLGQAVEPSHPNALHFLHRDCTNIIKFFKSRGLSDVPSPLQLFKKVSGISLPGPEESALRMIEEYERHQELWREGVNNLSDQFEFLWQEIQAEEKQQKTSRKREEDEDDDDDVKFEEVMDDKDRNVKESKKVDSMQFQEMDDGKDEMLAGEQGDAGSGLNPPSSQPAACGWKSSVRSSEKQSKKRKSKNKKSKGPSIVLE